MNPQEASKLYHFVTGRPPRFRTPQTDANFRFFLKHQKGLTQGEIVHIINQLQNAVDQPTRPWGSLFMTTNGLVPGQEEEGEALLAEPPPAPVLPPPQVDGPRRSSRQRQPRVFLESMFGR